MSDLADLRQSYERSALDAAALPTDPVALFRTWFDDATAAGVTEPNAMTLATVAPDGLPSARIVLLKGLDARGFVFYTNHASRKGRELDATGRAALVFWWPPLERQVRVEGRAERVADSEADAYFASRPHGSRLGAWASPQSEPVASREALEGRLADAASRFPGDDVPRPPFWGGYRIVPHAVEFWQGRPNRLHDRIAYHRAPGGGDDAWTSRRLAP